MLARSLAIWLALASSAFAQAIGGLSTVPPLTEARFPVSGLAVPSGSIDDLSKWASGLAVAVDSPIGAEASIEVDIGLVKRQPVIYFSGDKPGLYVLCLVDAKSKEPVIATKRVQVGEVVPPTPNPQPPGPTPVPVTSGKRVILLVREAGEVTPQMARMEVALRNGEPAKYLSDKGHILVVMSDDQKLPATASQAAKQAFEQAKGIAPALAIMDAEATGFSGVLSVERIKPDMTAAGIIEAVKKAGG